MNIVGLSMSRNFNFIKPIKLRKTYQFTVRSTKYFSAWMAADCSHPDLNGHLLFFK